MGGTARLKLLLDTHIWIWSMQASERLGKKTAQEIRNSENERWLSPVSTWEVLTLNAKGRLRLSDDIGLWVTEATASFQEAPLTHAIALAARRLDWEHSDPADRFLAATAQILGLTLVTADTRLLGLGNISTLANR
jgi:PIN domain nuclease of toxin-antitoxin system